MQGGLPELSLSAAVAVLDLHAAGVLAEMAETPFDWTEKPRDLPSAGPSVVPLRPQTVAEGIPVSVPVAPKEAPAPLLPKVVAAEVSAPAASSPGPEAEEVPLLWHGGEPGGVVVLMQGDAAPEGDEAALLQAMLRAVGLTGPLGMVGFAGGVASVALVEAMQKLAPTHLLVLGQDPLAALLSSKVGVDGWHAGAKREAVPAPLQGMPVGVTYPLALLLRQPLFKRLAWRHLLAWKAV